MPKTGGVKLFGGFEEYKPDTVSGGQEPKATITKQGKLILNVQATRRVTLFSAEKDPYVKLFYSRDKEEIAVELHPEKKEGRLKVTRITRVTKGGESRTAVISILQFLRYFGIPHSETTVYKVKIDANLLYIELKSRLRTDT